MVRPSPAIILRRRSSVKVPATIRRIEAQTLVDKAADEVKRLIDEGHFRLGDRLPSERELGARLGISRTVLREALSMLEALGFVESRSTRGRFVTKGCSEATSRALVAAWLHQHAAEIAEIDEVRLLIESHALRAASPDDLVHVLGRLRTTLAD
jgi:GntR family transcriptional repressor for pyruvate dehydrogenase complex